MRTAAAMVAPVASESRQSTSESFSISRAIVSMTTPSEAVTSIVQLLGLWLVVARWGPAIYTWLWRTVGGSDEAVSFVLTGILPFVVYIAYGIVLGAIDFGAPSWFVERYRVQKLAARPDVDDYIGAAWIGLRNSVFITLPYVAFISWFWLPLRGSHVGPTTLPLNVFVRDVCVFVLVEEVLFYYSHRALHHPRIYAAVHKFHHTYTAPFGIAAIYAHPLEHFVSNLFPVSAGPLVMGSHPFTTAIWSTVAIINTMSSHSGYALPGMPTPFFHDWHHERFNECFGVMGWLDLLHGTSTRFGEAQMLGRLHPEDGEESPAASAPDASSAAPAEEVHVHSYAADRPRIGARKRAVPRDAQ